MGKCGEELGDHFHIFGAAQPFDHTGRGNTNNAKRFRQQNGMLSLENPFGQKQIPIKDVASKKAMTR